ncbi:MAG: exodeoxyribonuclease VII small subunit [Candidatus Rokuibacteriota bacterium]|nr:MAG: exodeoxyribonuclease VII small subunit [Candidatus Rokubacteria bacterium]
MTDLKFEDCLARLEQIVSRLEGGNLPLEESLTIFEEGIGLARSCARYLEEAEKRIEVLAKDDTGALGARPFSWEPEREP